MDGRGRSCCNSRADPVGQQRHWHIDKRSATPGPRPRSRGYVVVVGRNKLAQFRQTTQFVFTISSRRGQLNREPFERGMVIAETVRIHDVNETVTEAMIDFRIQPAEASDWERIRTIRLRSLAESPNAFGTSLAEDEARPLAEWQARTKNEAVAHFLAMTNDDVSVGIAVGAPYTDYANGAGLFGMWVAPEARGHKVGSALVKEVIAWARLKDYKSIYLDVADTNHAAIRLYESCGFSPTGKTSSLPPPRQHILEHERMLQLQGAARK